MLNAGAPHRRPCNVTHSASRSERPEGSHNAQKDALALNAWANPQVIQQGVTDILRQR